MFELEYRIVSSGYDDFIGQNGFFKIKCNGDSYGELYPKEIENVMDKVSLYDWLERMLKVIINLNTKEYVFLSDVELFDTWIEFKRKNEAIIISIIKARKEPGTQDIEFILLEKKPGEWINQVIEFKQLKKEVIYKANRYIEEIILANPDNLYVKKIKHNYEQLMKQI